MGEIAVCIPTYGNPQVVEDVLRNSIEDYMQCDLDIYYYDSSDDCQTEEVVRGFQEQGYNNLYYVRMPSAMGVDTKVGMIFEGYGLAKSYTYIWPVKNRAYCPPETLRQIVKAAEDGYDIIFLGVFNMFNRPDIYTKTYDQAKEFYREWGWLATSLDVIIYKYSSMLSEFTREGFHSQYPSEHSIYWCAFVHMFHKLSKEQELRVRLLSDHDICINNSAFGSSSWRGEVFKIWKDYWIKANEELPEYYDEYKAVVIKEGASLPWLLGSEESLMKLHEAGILTPETYNSIVPEWEKVSDVPIDTVKEIAYGTYDCMHDIFAVRNTNSEMALLLIQLMKMLKEEKLSKEQIPFENILNGLYGELSAKKKLSQKELNIITGSALDLGSYIFKEETCIEEVVRAMQILIDFFILLN